MGAIVHLTPTPAREDRVSYISAFLPALGWMPQAAQFANQFYIDKLNNDVDSGDWKA